MNVMVWQLYCLEYIININDSILTNGTKPTWNYLGNAGGRHSTPYIYKNRERFMGCTIGQGDVRYIAKYGHVKK